MSWVFYIAISPRADLKKNLKKDLVKGVVLVLRGILAKH